jgi:hypothetical protein
MRVWLREQIIQVKFFSSDKEKAPLGGGAKQSKSDVTKGLCSEQELL